MVQSPRIDPASAPNGLPFAAPGRFVSECVRLLENRLPALWGTLFGKLDDALHNLADKSSNDLGYLAYFEARQIIGNQRGRIEAEFLRRVQQEAGDFIASDRNAAPDPEPAFDELALIADTELEEILAIENLLSKAESRYRSELLELDRRLAAVMGWEEVGLGENPFGPAALCNAFRATLSALPPLDPSVKLVIYKLFDRHVMDQLGDVYRGCIAGIDTERLGGPTAVARAKTERMRPTDAVEATRPALPEGAGLTIPFETLRRLLARQRRPRTAPPDSGPRMIPITTDELLGLLDNLDPIETEDPRSTEGESLLRDRLSRALTGGDRPPRALAERDEDTLDLVFLFFEHVLADPAIADPIKVLIGRMQIPVAKLALLDEGFFSDPSHPARRLINAIGAAAIGWSERDGRGSDGLYGMIERVIERLVLDFDGDPALFARMGRYFEAFVAREEALARTAAATAITEAERAAPPIDPERSLVAAAISDRLAPFARVPAPVEELLTEGWSRVLGVTYRTQGADSRDWQAALELVDRLLWSVSAKRTAEERRQLLARIPSLLENLRRQLSAAGCDQRLTARWLKELQTIHLDVLQGATVGAVLAADERDLSRRRGPRHAHAVGDWFIWTSDAGDPVRLKLMASSPERDALWFVDRQGQQALQLTEQGLVRAIESGRMQALGPGDHAIADSALQAMLARLDGPPESER